MAHIDTLSDDTFNELVINAKGPVLVDFSATWCGPCKMMAPAIDDLAREYDGEAAVYVLDIDACPATSELYSVRSVPMFMIFNNGKVVERVVGMTSRSKLAAMLEVAIEAAQ